MNALTYFAAQSPITDPGDNSHLFADLPNTVPEMCAVLQGICLDHEVIYKYPIANERLLETNLRYVNKILAQIIALDEQPLTEKRAPQNRFLGSSSHFVNLLVSMARYREIPARKRVGFATYFTEGNPGYHHTHDIIEYWDEDAGCWRQADPILDELAMETNGITLDPCDLPKDAFLPAGKVWQDCRTGKSNPELYRNEDTAGLEVIKNNLILDLASMNKHELLNWDRFGWMDRKMEEFCDEEWEILDRLAGLLQDGDEALGTLHTLYTQEGGLQVPRVIACNSPVISPHKVDLTK